MPRGSLRGGPSPRSSRGVTLAVRNGDTGSVVAPFWCLWHWRGGAGGEDSPRVNGSHGNGRSTHLTLWLSHCVGQRNHWLRRDHIRSLTLVLR